MIDDAAAEISARVGSSKAKGTTRSVQLGGAIDAELVAAYVAALGVERAATGKHDGEAAQQKVASIWFVMEIETQKAATLEAARAGLLEPRTDRQGNKLYPVVRGDRVVWVTVPDRDMTPR